MPLPKDMDKCMSKVKKEYPEGRSKNKKGKSASHKQHVVMCLNAQESVKSLIDGMTFSSFLITEEMGGTDTSNVRGFIRSLPTYQEMVKDPKAKSDALSLAREFLQAYGDGQIDSNAQDDIIDSFDDLSRKMYPRGAMMGDWAGEDAYKKRKEAEADIEQAADSWENEIGTNAETGEELPQKRRMSGARTGMDYMANQKSAQAKSDMASFDQAPKNQQADRLAQAKNQVSTGPVRGEKKQIAMLLYQEMEGSRPSEIIRAIMDEAGLSKQGATTYYYNAKKVMKSQ